jgi:sphingomyelin phosphodiesterase acid-like 3
MRQMWLRRLLLLACTGVLGLWTVGSEAQAARTRKTVPALLISDIHFDPFHDPAKAAQLLSTPVARWGGVLDTAASATQHKDVAVLNEVCHDRGLDTDERLWRSSLAAMHAQGASSAFVVVSGDLLAHNFECKFKKTYPTATDQDYVTFVTLTVKYVVRGLQLAFPARPLYIGMGNNDSACGDYRDDRNSPFLDQVAKILTRALPPDDEDTILRDFSLGGYYNAPLPRAFPHARIIVLDDLFLSAHYATCEGKAEGYAADQQIAWLRGQLAEARERKEHVLVVGHIPPGIDLFATLRKGYVCGQTQTQSFLRNEKLAEVLEANADVVRLAIFGHSHTDELRLLSDDGPKGEGGSVPVKIVTSISPVNGNNPAFTIGRFDPETANLMDYTVIAASNPTGIGTTWTKEYTFSETFHQPSFTAPTLEAMTKAFKTDSAASTPASNAYLRDLYVGDRSMLLKPLWPEYVCALTHASAQAYVNCVCPK